LGHDVRAFVIDESHSVVGPGLQDVDRFHDAEEPSRAPFDFNAVADDLFGEV